MPVDYSGVSQWFAEYLDAFAACGRGEKSAAALLGYYGVPLLLTTDAGFVALTSGDELVAAFPRWRSIVPESPARRH